MQASDTNSLPAVNLAKEQAKASYVNLVRRQKPPLRTDFGVSEAICDRDALRLVSSSLPHSAIISCFVILSNGVSRKVWIMIVNTRCLASFIAVWLSLCLELGFEERPADPKVQGDKVMLASCVQTYVENLADMMARGLFDELDDYIMMAVRS